MDKLVIKMASQHPLAAHTSHIVGSPVVLTLAKNN